MIEIVKLLKTAPDGSLDKQMQPYIAKWSDPPTPLQVLEVLDHCINGALANGMVIRVLQVLYDERCAAEGVKHEDVAKNAKWREELGV